MIDHGFLVTVNILLLAAVTFLPVLGAVGLPVFAEVVDMGGGDGLAGFQQRIADAADGVAGVAGFKFGSGFLVDHGFLVTVNILLLAAVAFQPVLGAIGFPSFTEVVDMGGGDGLAGFQQRATDAADGVAGIAFFKFGSGFLIDHGFLMTVNILLLAAVAFQPVLGAVGFPVFTEVVDMAASGGDGEIVGKEMLLRVGTWCDNHKREGNAIAVGQGDGVAVIRNGGAGVCRNGIDQSGLVTPNILVFRIMPNHSLNQVGVCDLITAVSVGGEDLFKMLGKQDFQRLGDICSCEVVSCQSSAACGSKGVAGISALQIAVKAITPITVGKQNICITCGLGGYRCFCGHDGKGHHQHQYDQQ